MICYHERYRPVYVSYTNNFTVNGIWCRNPHKFFFNLFHMNHNSSLKHNIYSIKASFFFSDVRLLYTSICQNKFFCWGWEELKKLDNSPSRINFIMSIIISCEHNLSVDFYIKILNNIESITWYKRGFLNLHS